MTSMDEVAVDGIRSDGVGHTPATLEQLAGYRQAAEKLAQLRTPVLLDISHPHQRLYVQMFDGTGNNKFKDPLHVTNVASISDQLEALSEHGRDRIHVEYQVGPGTQNSKISQTADLVRGHTFEPKVEEIYDRLVRQINQDMRADPRLEPRFASVGFSRGASQTAGFARVLDERGIPDLSSRLIGVNGEEVYSRYLVRPGETIQAVGLFDPVATGVPMAYDRRLPPSVVSAFQITANDEFRKTFPSDELVPRGLSANNRFLNVSVAGAHSDIGGSYHRNGLSARSGNLMVDYLNGLSNEPFLKKSFEPTDIRYNVIHKSTEGMLIYRLDPRDSVRGQPSGTNTVLAPRRVVEAGPVPHQPQPMNELLALKLTYRLTPQGMVPTESATVVPPMATAEAVQAAGRSVPLAPTLVRVANLAAVAYDGTTSGLRAKDLLQHGNHLGAESTLIHFGARNLGMVAGAEVGTGMGLIGGIEMGPGAFVTGLLGGAAGAYGGEKVADHIDQYVMTHQKDPQGNTWLQRNDGHWVREEQKVDWNASAYNEGVPVIQSSELLVADKDLGERLTYQCMNDRMDLSLHHPNMPRNPFEQPSAVGDRESVEPASWIRDPDTHAWTRKAVVAELEHGVKSTVTDTASPERAAQLNKAAAQTMAENAYISPHGLAQQYEIQFHEQHWDRFGGMPHSVRDHLPSTGDVLMASDGRVYTRDAQGDWTTPDRLYGTTAATGNLREELNITHGFVQQLDADHLASLQKLNATPDAVLSRDVPLRSAEDREAARNLASLNGGDAAGRGQAAKVLQDQQRVARPGEQHPEHEGQAQSRQAAMLAHTSVTQAALKEQRLDQATHHAVPDTYAQQSTREQSVTQLRVADLLRAAAEVARQQEHPQANSQQENEASARQDRQIQATDRQRDAQAQRNGNEHVDDRQPLQRLEATAKVAAATHSTRVGSLVPHDSAQLGRSSADPHTPDSHAAAQTAAVAKVTPTSRAQEQAVDHALASVIPPRAGEVPGTTVVQAMPYAGESRPPKPAEMEFSKTSVVTEQAGECSPREQEPELGSAALVHGAGGSASDERFDASSHLNRSAVVTQPTRLDDLSHPDYAFYMQTREKVHQLDQKLGRQPDHHSDQVAAALTVQARAGGFQHIDEVAMATDGSKFFGAHRHPGRTDNLFNQYTEVPTSVANVPMEQSAALWPKAMQQFQQVQEQSQAREQAWEQSRQQSQQQSGQGPAMSR